MSTLYSLENTTFSLDSCITLCRLQFCFTCFEKAYFMQVPMQLEHFSVPIVVACFVVERIYVVMIVKFLSFPLTNIRRNHAHSTYK